jgi:hypothetical protein
MECPKCRGLMITQWMKDDITCRSVQMYRCLNCGKYLDLSVARLSCSVSIATSMRLDPV